MLKIKKMSNDKTTGEAAKTNELMIEMQQKTQLGSPRIYRNDSETIIQIRMTDGTTYNMWNSHEYGQSIYRGIYGEFDSQDYELLSEENDFACFVKKNK